MENNFKKLIDESNSVLVLLPKSPYFDQVAAGLSLYLALEKTKTVAIASESEMTVEFNRLVGVDKIGTEIGNKNLVIKFKNYQAQNIERVTYDIENEEFRLSVIPKPQMTPPTKDQINVTYSGISADTIILIGGGNESHFPMISKPELAGAKKAHIGLGTLNAQNKDILNFAQTSSSTTEVMFFYLKQLGVEIDPDIASNLLAGIHEGSKNFSSSYVTANTFQAASELMQLGGIFSATEKPQKTYTARDFGQKATQPAPSLIEEKPAVSTNVSVSPIANMEIDENEPDEEDASAETVTSTTDTQMGDAPKSWLEPKIYKGASNK